MSERKGTTKQKKKKKRKKIEITKLPFKYFYEIIMKE